jgi:hypothetical protein
VSVSVSVRRPRPFAKAMHEQYIWIILQNIELLGHQLNSFCDSYSEAHVHVVLF